MKTCSMCKNIKSFDAFGFSKASKDGLKSRCRNCRFTEYKILKNKDPQKYRKKQNVSTTAYRRKYPKRRQNALLYEKYGITLIQYENLSNIQNNRCAICYDFEEEIDKRTGKIKALAVDHCHASSKIRGLLCSQCNKGLGMFEDKPSRLQRAIKYLEKAFNEL